MIVARRELGFVKRKDQEVAAMQHQPDTSEYSLVLVLDSGSSDSWFFLPGPVSGSGLDPFCWCCSAVVNKPSETCSFLQLWLYLSPQFNFPCIKPNHNKCISKELYVKAHCWDNPNLKKPWWFWAAWPISMSIIKKRNFLSSSTGGRLGSDRIIPKVIHKNKEGYSN